jgi:hypothetical protein
MILYLYGGGDLVTLKSNKQKLVALSSAEAEFRGMTNELCEVLWIKRLFEELGYPIDTEIKMYCDNKAAIAINNNPIQYDRTKYM